MGGKPPSSEPRAKSHRRLSGMLEFQGVRDSTVSDRHGVVDNVLMLGPAYGASCICNDLAPKEVPKFAWRLCCLANSTAKSTSGDPFSISLVRDSRVDSSPLTFLCLLLLLVSDGNVTSRRLHWPFVTHQLNRRAPCCRYTWY